MNKSIKQVVSTLTCIFSIILLASNLQASSLEQIQQVGEKKLVEAEQSQKRIDKIVEGAQERLIQYRALLKQIEGLKTYNEQLATQVAGQQDLLVRFDQSISQVALIERQMSPLVTKMADSLDQFVELDLPFHTAERQERMAFIQESLAAADVDVAEKFRQVIEAYQIENEYGRKIDSYQDIVTLEGSEQEVDVLRVGRIALVCQTKNSKISGSWNNDTQVWDVIDNVDYRNAIRYGIKMAKKQAPVNILTLPIAEPEAAQ